MSGSTDVVVRMAAAADRMAVSANLACAFQNDPVMCFLFPNTAVRHGRLPGLFAQLFDRDSTRLMTADAAAATLWQAPGVRRMSLLDKVRESPIWLRIGGSAILRLLSFGEASDANRPAVPHWYLHVAGCVPAVQGRGLGRAAIQAGLDLADSDGLPAYLDTATKRNLDYYQALGFAVTGEWTVRRSLQCWSMQRPVATPKGRIGL